MGCDNSKKEEVVFDVATEFQKANLAVPFPSQTESELERRIYMSVNMLRWEPNRFSKVVAETQRKWAARDVLPKEPQHFDDLMNHLAKAARVQNILMDDQAIRACRENCKEVCALEEAVPKKGGNIERYAQISGASSAVEAEN